MNLRKIIREAITSNDDKYASIWNKMSVEQRIDILKRSDPTMRSERWLAMIKSMALKTFEELGSSMRQDAVVYALKRPIARR